MKFKKILSTILALSIVGSGAILGVYATDDSADGGIVAGETGGENATSTESPSTETESTLNDKSVRKVIDTREFGFRDSQDWYNNVVNKYKDKWYDQLEVPGVGTIEQEISYKFESLLSTLSTPLHNNALDMNGRNVSPSEITSLLNYDDTERVYTESFGYKLAFNFSNPVPFRTVDPFNLTDDQKSELSRLLKEKIERLGLEEFDNVVLDGVEVEPVDGVDGLKVDLDFHTTTDNDLFKIIYYEPFSNLVRFNRLSNLKKVPYTGGTRDDSTRGYMELVTDFFFTYGTDNSKIEAISRAYSPNGIRNIFNWDSISAFTDDEGRIRLANAHDLAHLPKGLKVVTLPKGTFSNDWEEYINLTHEKYTNGEVNSVENLELTQPLALYSNIFFYPQVKPIEKVVFDNYKKTLTEEDKIRIKQAVFDSLPKAVQDRHNLCQTSIQSLDDKQGCYLFTKENNREHILARYENEENMYAIKNEVIITVKDNGNVEVFYPLAGFDTTEDFQLYTVDYTLNPEEVLTMPPPTPGNNLIESDGDVGEDDPTNKPTPPQPTPSNEPTPNEHTPIVDKPTPPTESTPPQPNKPAQPKEDTPKENTPHNPTPNENTPTKPTVDKVAPPPLTVDEVLKNIPYETGTPNERIPNIIPHHRTPLRPLKEMPKTNSSALLSILLNIFK